jgi:streptogramin lyase
VIISGVVKDDGGKALRGAMITASSGYKSVSRFSDKAGRYTIADLQPGAYEVSATGWGFERKVTNEELTADSKLNYTLDLQWIPNRLSSADWLAALPENEEIQTLKTTCIKCHNLSWIVRRRGLTASQWTHLVTNMGVSGNILQGKVIGKNTEGGMFRTSGDKNEPQLAAALGAILAKYFGPNSPLPTRDQVRHPPISDAVLRATFREYKSPTRAYAHSVMPDREGKYVWFNYWNETGAANQIGRFEIANEKFVDIKLPANAGNPWTSKDGKRVWAVAGNVLFEFDAKTGEFSEHKPPMKVGRTMGEDSAGNIWLSGDSITKFDPKAVKFEEFPIAKVSDLPEHFDEVNLNTKYYRAEREEGKKEFGTWAYDLAIDSHDNVWYTHYETGHLVRLNPKTKESKVYRIPNAIKIKGIAIGPDDTVWAGNFDSGTLIKLDPKTGQVDQYQPPTHHAAFYTPAVAKDGQVWLSDFTGSQLTKFNPATREFTEYPFPSTDGMVRFFGFDPQGRVWYADTNGLKIGVLDPGDMASAHSN